MKNKKMIIILYVLAAIYGIYAVTCCFYIGFSGGEVVSTIISIFMILLISFTICLILVLSARKAWGKFLSKLDRHKDAKEFDDYYSSLNDEANAFSEKGYFKEKVTPKKFFLSLLIFVALGIGYVPLTILGANEINHIAGKNFVKTEAVVTKINSNNEFVSLNYTYYSKETNKTYIYKPSSSFSGVSFKEGKKITIYYNKFNPEIVKTASTAILFFVGASFFFIIGILACFLNMGYNSTGFNSIMLGLIFSVFGAGFSYSIALSGGFSFVEALFSGPL